MQFVEYWHTLILATCPTAHPFRCGAHCIVCCVVWGRCCTYRGYNVGAGGGALVCLSVWSFHWPSILIPCPCFLKEPSVAGFICRAMVVPLGVLCAQHTFQGKHTCTWCLWSLMPLCAYLVGGTHNAAVPGRTTSKGEHGIGAQVFPRGQGALGVQVVHSERGCFGAHPSLRSAAWHMWHVPVKCAPQSDAWCCGPNLQYVIPLPRRGRTLDWWMNKTKVSYPQQKVCAVYVSTFFRCHNFIFCPWQTLTGTKWDVVTIRVLWVYSCISGTCCGSTSTPPKSLLSSGAILGVVKIRTFRVY